MKKFVSLMLSLLILFNLLVFINQTKSQQYGPVSDKLIFIAKNNETEAIELVKKGGDFGGIDLYLSPISLEKLKLIDENISKIINKKGKIFSLLLNPVPMNVSGKFNIFEFKEIRYALQFAVERRVLKQEIFQGYAEEMKSPISYYDYDWRNVIDIVEGKKKIRDDKEFALKLINETLLKNNATLNGIWKYKNEEIKIKIVAKQTNIKAIQIAYLLEEFFENDVKILTDVILSNNTFILNNIYRGDPKNLTWNIYIEEWGFYEFFKYSEFIVANMYSPWYGNMPGWNVETYWNYKNKTIDELTEKLIAGDYLNEKERNFLLRKAIEIGIEESIRIFLVQRFDVYIYNKRRVEGTINEYANGIANIFNLINIKPKENPEEPLKIGFKISTIDSWNPIGGLNDFYFSLIFNLISDNSFLRNPYTGNLISWRVNFEILNSSNIRKFKVPSDAIYWDSKVKEWKFITENIKVNSIINYEIIYNNWHDGSKMNIYDILYWLYFIWEWSSKDGEKDEYYNEAFALKYKPFALSLKAIRIIDDNRLTLFLNYNHFDKSEIASYFPLFPKLPWQIFFAIEKGYLDEKFAWFKFETFLKNITWLDLTRVDHAEIIKDILTEFNNTNLVPKALIEKFIIPISLEEAKIRYNNSIKFIEKNSHSLISNGIFMLEKVTLKNLVLKANRDYPISQEIWKKFEEEKIVSLKIFIENKLFKEGTNLLIDIFVNITNENATDKNTIVYYFIFDPEKELKFQEKAEYIKENLFRINKSTEGWQRGVWEIKIFALTNYSLIPAILIEKFSVLKFGREINATITVSPPEIPRLNVTNFITPNTTTTIIEEDTEEKIEEENNMILYNFIIIALLSIIAIFIFLFFIRKK